MRQFAFFLIVMGALSSGERVAAAETAKTLSFAEFGALAETDQVDYLETLRRVALAAEGGSSAAAATNLRELFWQASVPFAAAAPGGFCAYAGYVSKFNARDLCVPPAAATKSWTVVTPAGKTVSQRLCTGSGQTLCNPMLYGFGTYNSSTGSYSGICTTSRTRPTTDCEQKYQSLPNYPAATIAKQLVAGGYTSEFNSMNSELSDYCTGEGKTRQRDVCRTMTRKTTYMKEKIRLAGKSTPTVAKPAVVPPSRPLGNSERNARIPPSASVPTPAPRAVEPGGSVPLPSPRPATARPKPTTTTTSNVPLPTPRPEDEPAPVEPTVPATRAPEDVGVIGPASAKGAAATDNCIRNTDDLATLKAKLPEKMRKLPVRFTVDDMVKTAALQIRSVDKRLKLEGHVWEGYVPFANTEKIYMDDGYIDRICFDSKTPGALKIVLDNGEEREIVVQKDKMTLLEQTSNGSKTEKATFRIADEAGYKKIVSKINAGAAAKPGVVKKSEGAQ